MLHASLSGLGITLADLASEVWQQNVKLFGLILPGRLFIFLVILKMQWDGECVFGPKR
ncbi:MAG TPA: hypothetical protein VNA25_20825 [Phycisphaerae bacterium]|nr:hypothetical protein [Phycisphaerae bacterium]